jgi:hypothetical protein
LAVRSRRSLSKRHAYQRHHRERDAAAGQAGQRRGYAGHLDLGSTPRDTFGRPFEAVRPRRREGRQGSTGQEREKPEDGDHAAPPAALSGAARREQPRLGPHQEGKDGCRGQALRQADRKMDGQHHGRERQERQVGHSRERGGDHHAECTQLDAHDGREHDRHGPEPPLARQEGPGERPCHEAGEEAHVQQVRPQRQQASVGEDERLHAEHRGHHEHRTPGAEKDGQKQTAPEVTAASRARNGEVHHLGGKDEGAEHARESDLARLVPGGHPPGGHGQQPAGPNPTGHSHGGRQKCIKKVHGWAPAIPVL